MLRSRLPRASSRSDGQGRCRLGAALGRQGWVRETCASQPWRRVTQDAFWAGGLSGDGVGDFGEDVGVVGEAESFGCPGDLVGGVGGEGAGDLGQLRVRDGPHVLIDRDQFLVRG